MASSERMQNPPTPIGFAFTVILSAVAGTIPTAILASADNGYVAGYMVPPLLFLTAVVCILLILCSLAFIANERFAIALYFLLSVLLIPAFWFGSAMAAHYFELGAYRVEPMQPFDIR